MKNRITEFVKTWWYAFNEAGVKIPAQGYELVIDTGNHRPITDSKPHYGLFESPIMHKTIDQLASNRFIRRDVTSPWGFRITLVPKPHQEHVTDIAEYIWRFCTNYIMLNIIT
jgi:hypothetical protein